MATKRNKRTDAATNGNEVETTWTDSVTEEDWKDIREALADKGPLFAVMAYEAIRDGYRDEEADAMPGCPPGCPGNCPPGCCGFQFGPDDPDLQSPLGLA